jgi:hypothetical protein
LNKGLVGTYEDIAAPVGAATYNYRIIARDKMGALTAASPVGTTSTGQATLGDIQVSVTSCSRANNIVTCNTAVATSLVTGATFWIQNTSDITFNGPGQVASVNSSTQFTFNQGVDTRSGGSTSATGGTLDYYVANHLTWTLVPNAWEYYIYGRTGGSLTLLGVSRPLETQFDDWGTTMMGTPSFPAYVPNTPPVAATNDPLVTTIVSGAGTTTLVLANAATNAVTGARAIFDNSPNILAARAAAQSSPLYIPSTANSNAFFPINSYTNFTGIFGNTNIMQSGALSLTETLEISDLTNWFGDRGGSSVQSSVAAWTQGRIVNCSAGANPCVYELTLSGHTRIRGLSFLNQSDQALIWLADEGFQHTYEFLDFTTGFSAADYLGVGYEGRGVVKVQCFYCSFNPNLDNGGPLGLWAPALHIRGDDSVPAFGNHSPGQLMMRAPFMYAKGINFDATVPNSGIFVDVDGYYTQGSRTPLFTFTQSFGGSLLNLVSIKNPFTDTSAAPLIANLGNSLNTVYLENIGGASSGQVNVTGNPISNLVVNGTAGPIGPNTGLSTSNGSFSTNNVSVGGYGTFTYNFPVVTPTPNVVVSAGGNVPVGAHNYSIQWLDINGNTYGLGPVAVATTTTGNQTVTVSIPPGTIPVGAQQWFVIRDGGRANLSTQGGNCANGPGQAGLPTNVVFVDSYFAGCGNSVAFSGAAGPVSISQIGLNGPGFNLVNNGLRISSSFRTPLTANRSILVPDFSGLWELSGYQNSFYDNFNRANGAIGSNYTVTNGALNVSGNVLSGTTTNQFSAATVNASINYAGDQFCEFTVTAMNGTTDQPACALRMNGFTFYHLAVNTGAWFLNNRTGQFSATGLISGAIATVIGDSFRLEISGTTLSVFRNGVFQGSVVDSSYATGLCGPVIYGNIATIDNFSCGNLHPFAHLDIEQDWTTPQHFNSLSVGQTTSQLLNSSLGNTGRIQQASLAAFVSNNLVKFDPNGNTIDANIPASSQGAGSKLLTANLVGNNLPLCTDAGGAAITACVVAPSSAQTSAATNFGTNLTAQTVISSVASTGMVTLSLQPIQTLAGASCTAASNTVLATISWTAPGSTTPTLTTATVTITGNGALDSGATANNTDFTFVAKSGTAVTYTTTSALASTGCAPVPQYTVYAKAIQ